MATKKVRKFASGGDILTALGAGLAGYGAYKYFTKDKDDETKPKLKVPEGGIDLLGKPKTDKKDDSAETKVEDKVETKTDSGRNSNLSPVEQHAAITKRSSVGSSDAAPVTTNARKPKKVDDKKKTTTTTTTTNDAPTFRGLGMEGSDKGAKSKPYPLGTVSNEFRQSKPYPAREVTEAKKKEVRDKENEEKDKGYSNQSPTAKAIRRTVRETFPYASDLGDPRGTPSMRARNADPSRAYLHEMAEKGKQKEKERKAREAREAEEKAKKRKGAADINYDISGNVINKRGGVIRKFASGGSVKTAKPTMRSASSRADGIAIRGKTRA